MRRSNNRTSMGIESDSTQDYKTTQNSPHYAQHSSGSPTMISLESDSFGGVDIQSKNKSPLRHIKQTQLLKASILKRRLRGCFSMNKGNMRMDYCIPTLQIMVKIHLLIWLPQPRLRYTESGDVMVHNLIHRCLLKNKIHSHAICG